MMITKSDWIKYITQLASVNQKAAGIMQSYVDKVGYDLTPKLMKFAYTLTSTYGEASAELACQMYDKIATAQKAGVEIAEQADTATFNEVVDAIRRSYEHSKFETPATVGRLVKRTASDTILKNAKRDGAYFAWIPSGDGCPFCRVIASNGWRKAGKKTLKGNHATHIHNNCKCEYAVRFNSSLGVEGYDPEKFYKEYDEADGSNWNDKVNSMRRSDYAENKDEINAQKRAAYKRRKDV